MRKKQEFGMHEDVDRMGYQVGSQIARIISTRINTPEPLTFNTHISAAFTLHSRIA